EFTIPLTLRRYFGRRATPAPVAASAPTTKDTVAALDSAAIAQRRLAGADSGAPRDTAPAPRDTVRVVHPPQASTPASAVDSARAPAAAAAPTRRAPAVAASAAVKPAARTVRTRIKNIGYLQTRLEVVAGTTVEWTNGDPLAHTVTAVDRSFDSGLIQPGKTFRHTFAKPGSYAFYCMPHPFMQGVVVVRAP
ncbi:MAG TPA: plastocyanin/azurin family copper-binding protein, partial [Gemmatimonadaceae bacterium]|nr:plastocyanin/azurin family copper-binding protein [Gemmatimonadaceae bacterium]